MFSGIQMLMRSSVKLATWSRYIVALAGFTSLFKDNAISPNSFDNLDWALQMYFQEQYFEGGSRQHCVKAITGIIVILPRERLRLPRARLIMMGSANIVPMIIFIAEQEEARQEREAYEKKAKKAGVVRAVVMRKKEQKKK